MMPEFKNSGEVETEGLLRGTSITINKPNIVEEGSCDDKNNTETEIDEKEEHEQFLKQEFADPCRPISNSNLKLERDKIFTVNKSLLAFRITLFTWCGGGSLPGLFIDIFLKQRGLTFVELSSIFSLIFFLYLIICFITGIITDKIGNAKPVLMFLMVSSSAVLVCMSLTPNINTVSCIPLDGNLNHSQFTNFSSCYVNCLLNNDDPFKTKENHSTLVNSSLPEIFYQKVDKSNFLGEILCNSSNSSLKNISHQFLIGDCCNACVNSTNFNPCYVNCLLKNEEHFHSKENQSVLVNGSYPENFYQETGDFSGEFLCNTSDNEFKNISRDCCNACINSTTTECVTVRNGYLVAAYATLTLIFFSVWSTTYRFLDFTAVNIAAKYGSHYGKERFFGMSGTVLILAITGFMLNMDKSSGTRVQFDSVIWIAVGVMFCAFLMLFTTSVPILPPGKNFMRKALSLAKDIDILSYILLVFVAGNAFAFHFTFHLILLESIKATRIVVGLHSLMIYLYGFPVLLTFQWWLKKFGANKLFVLGLLFHAINNVAYSYITDPWLCLVIDISVIFTFHLFWSAVVVHCRSKAPVGFAATLNALTGAVHFGVGRSSGVFIGGMIANYMGLRKAYKIMAAACFSTAVLYSVYLCARRKRTPLNTAVNGNETSNSKCSRNTDMYDLQSKRNKLLKICK